MKIAKQAVFTCSQHKYSGDVPCPTCAGGQVPSRPEHVRPGNQPKKAAVRRA